MLPDLRIVIAAVLSTFVLTAGVGFYASSRLINEPMKRPDSLAAFEETPVNRIALSWPPPPTQQSESLALDFAVTARALRNPVRDVTDEVAATEVQPQEPPVRTAASAPASPPAATDTSDAPSAPVASPKAVPEPDIRIAVQYPPVPELPPELRAPLVVPAAMPPAINTKPEAIEAPAMTGSVAVPSAKTEPAKTEPAKTEPAKTEPAKTESAKSEPIPIESARAKPAEAETARVEAAKTDSDKTGPAPETEPSKTAAPPDPEPTARKTASRPDPADDGVGKAQVQESDAAVPPLPVAKPPRKKAAPKAAPKKAAPPKAAKRPVRRPAPRAATATPNFFNFFTVRN